MKGLRFTVLLSLPYPKTTRPRDWFVVTVQRDCFNPYGFMVCGPQFGVVNSREECIVNMQS